VKVGRESAKARTRQQEQALNVQTDQQLMKKLLQHTPVFLFLLPVFFVLHGLNENFGFINLPDCLLLVLTYAGAAALLYFLFLFFLKNYVRAALMATYLMAFYCFFGALQDFFKSHSLFLYKYSVLVTAFVIIGLVLTIYFRKTKKGFTRFSLFINILLLIYLAVDCGGILWKLIFPPPNKLAIYSLGNNDQYKVCSSCARPDIYFLLFDEYESTRALKRKYNYDDSGLDSFLLGRGFHIQTRSQSNYQLTPFSLASLLNMSYLSRVDPHHFGLEDYSNCAALIRTNETIRFLTYQGYDIINYSIFDLLGNPSEVEQTVLPIRTRLITDRTLFARLERDIGWWFYTGRFQFDWLTGKLIYKTLENNNKIIELTEKQSAQKGSRPRFVYAHILMPHPPFYYDRGGNLKSKSTIFSENDDNHVEAYLDYIPQTNKRIRELIETIQENTRNSAVIIFMGDHGFRPQTTDEYPVDFFQNQNAVFFPDKDYHLLYDSMTNVNMFRIVFDKMFDQNIPLLKDTSIYLHDKP
jgi:hypothetical protein